MNFADAPSKSNDLKQEAPAPIAIELIEPNDQLLDVDLSQIQLNLDLTAEARLIEHQYSLDLVFQLEAAGKALREKSK